jgi:hypothetical protein
MKSLTKQTFVKNNSLKTDLFFIRDRIFDDENLKQRMAYIRNRIPITNNQKDIQMNKQILSTRMASRTKVTQVTYNQMDRDNMRLLNKIKSITTRARTPDNKLDGNSVEKNDLRRMNILGSNNEKRKLDSKSIQLQNTSMYSRLTRIHSPLSKKTMLIDFKKHEKWVSNSKNLRGFSKGVNLRMEKLVTPYLPRLSPRMNSGFHNKSSPNKSKTSSPKYDYGKSLSLNKSIIKLNTINYKSKPDLKGSPITSKYKK